MYHNNPSAPVQPNRENGCGFRLPFDVFLHVVACCGLSQLSVPQTFTRAHRRNFSGLRHTQLPAAAMVRSVLQLIGQDSPGGPVGRRLWRAPASPTPRPKPPPQKQEDRTRPPWSHSLVATEKLTRALHILSRRHGGGEPKTSTRPSLRRRIHLLLGIASHGGATWATRAARAASRPLTLILCRHAAPAASGGESMAKVPLKSLHGAGLSAAASRVASLGR